jgi:hypothetical protein
VLDLGAPPEEARREPALGLARTVTQEEDRFEPLLVDAPAPREVPRADLRLSLPPSAAETARPERPVESRIWRRPVGATISLLLHLLALALILERPMPKPAEIEPIPVQLVVEPPPAPKPPAPKPPPPKPPELKPEVEPPRGRIASEDIGDTTAKPAKDAATTPPEAKPIEQQQTAALIPPPPEPEQPAGLKDEIAPRPQPKPKPAIRPPPRRSAEPPRPHPAARPARYPGPAATRDEYLAYLAWLARQHIGLLPLALVGNRRGETVVDILVLGDGTIAMLRVGRSSGWHDIDLRIEQMIAAVGRFPPLPQWYQGPSMQLEFRLRFPEALQN